MKKGNQFYLQLQITDDNDNLLDIRTVDKVQFNIENVTKIYDGVNDEVIYEDESFKVWLTEQETFKFKNKAKIDARVLFKNDTIAGTIIQDGYFYDSLNEVFLDVEN